MVYVSDKSSFLSFVGTACLRDLRLNRRKTWRYIQSLLNCSQLNSILLSEFSQ